jgi:ribonuclease HI
LLRFGSNEKTLTGRDPQSTNNRMELTAAIEAIKALNTPCSVELYTDSEYLKRGITEWLPVWKARNWKRKGGKLANLDLWQELDQSILPHRIEWHWLRGHAGNRFNQKVDRLARQAINKS